MVVVDSETPPHATGRARALASAINATHAELAGLEDSDFLRLAFDRAG
jgi:hypothetical protein